MNTISNIGVFTSGGDAPGMNACIRAVVRTAVYEGKKVTGIYHGYQGMLDGTFVEMNSRSVSNIIQKGGTILKTARCIEFRTPEGRAKAYENLKAQGIDGLVAIGGDGTFTGADFFSREYDIPVMCIPGTIDNDLYGSDYTLGYDTATNTVIDAIDKIRDTAASHGRLFFIEVMGRDSGCIALNAGIAGGAEAIMLPEKETAIDELIDLLERAAFKQKTSTIVIVAEGDKNGGAYNVAKRVKEKFDYYDTKVSILGHLQRGGSPSSFDRVLASRMGYAAVKHLLQGKTRMTVGLRGNEIILTPLEEALNNKEFKLSNDMLEISQIMAI
ncbi:6-phosphofructokinase [Sphingobacterium spiritivorum]|uniref:ATP-dependent 6-phosphofructokinase n=1 Tax=Sphingobacterium spiritivorum ATCC 33861 TaxID=525373 RepID=D7VJX8_SPHSI|nr:6-phosphofructokinase [Sphingobacterium spiritivorum]EFK58580.1 6-phosphofructokinase [Sphingobacterium spiritivorum ATCC 33861]QQT34514.1 6-phosphofructokinase [Sphingobacterium spiritivorum]WQD35373.1 6-phosphofructokinase [Sphingobacterium spiritivorum]SUJ00222.1 6-phosphofructokinase isozyme 1 [Sphingobacterium spiritivorum]